MTGKVYKWDKPRGPKWFRLLIKNIYDTLTAIQPIEGLGTDVSEGTVGRPISLESAGKKGGGAVLPNDYTFKMVDASDEPGVAALLIMDGGIWGPNDEDITYPAGMPSEDTYVLDVADNDEIWVGMTWSGADPPTITSAWIDHGPTTPEDEEETTYVTLGYVHVDYGDVAGAIPKIFPTNQHCGDIIIQIPPQPFEGKFLLEADERNLIWQETIQCQCDEQGVNDGGP